MDGLLVIDKPAGLTSHDVVACVRRLLGASRVGHTGTLDPLATGVLPVVIGRATRLARFLTASDKEYEAVVRLGVATDTYDAEGTPLAGTPVRNGLPGPDEIERTLATFVGPQLQTPPPFCAKKREGVRAYALARQGRAPRLSPLPVNLERLELVGADGDRLTLRLTCSSGFYVRSLAHDLGARLGTGAHLEALRRTRSGCFTLEDAVGLGDLTREAAPALVVPLDALLTDMPAAVVTLEGAERTIHGATLEPAHLSGAVPAPAGGPVRVLDGAGHLLAMADWCEPGILHPAVVLV